LVAVPLACGCGGDPFETAGVATDGGAADVDAPYGGDAQGEEHFADVGTDGRADAAPDAADSGAVDAYADAPVCITDLSWVGTGDFHVTFTIATTETSTMSLVNQRPVCDFSTFWDVWMGQVTSGEVDFAVDDNTQGGYVMLRSTGKVNDGQPHKVVAERVSGVMALVIDGKPSGTTAAGTALGQLPALKTGTNACLYTPLNGHGQLTDLCITKP
jgi:hypothetical protein